jgi:PAS domain S-box-containing protein
MAENVPHYNSRLIKVWIEYLSKYQPEVDLDSLLAQAGMGRYEVEDPGHWYTQEQVDRFYEVARKETGDQDVALKAGRYVPFCDGLSYINQFASGFLSPRAVYLLMNTVSAHMTRAAAVTTKRIGPNKVEIVSTPKPGVVEKPYQCENRTGMFEAIPQFFKFGFATSEHPECFHRGDGRCRYILSWKPSTSAKWKQVRNFSFVFGLLASILLSFFLPTTAWLGVTLFLVLLTAGISAYQLKQKNRELTQAVVDQSTQAKNYMDEMDVRYNHAMLIQEIGQATSHILEEQALTEAVVQAMDKRLDFDRGLCLLADEDNTRLIFSAGYGYDEKYADMLQNTAFNLKDSLSKGVFIMAFRRQEPYLIDDFSKVSGDLSERSYEFANAIGVQSLICVPMVYEKKSLGILAVDNVRSKRLLTKSDIGLLSGIASQTAVSLTNARAFKKLTESGKEYRELVETANSIILRRDTNGRITFFNGFAQRRFEYGENEIVGKNIIGTLLPDTQKARADLNALNATLQATPDLNIVQEDAIVLRNGETVWIAWTFKPIFNSDNKIAEILCIGNDITSLKSAQIEKKELESRLHRSQKMEALGTLAGGVAHDLNNILSGMVSYPELLLVQLPSDSPMRKALETIHKSGEKAAAIVQDLLTMARRGVAVADVVNLNHVLSEYLMSPEHARLKTAFPDVDFDIKMEKELLSISGSDVHLSKTIMNLVANAAEAMDKGGTVTISTENRYVDRPVRGYDDVKKGDYSVLIISDTGVGIAASDIERIFEPFYTSKKMGRSGTGLGMAVVWGTVKDHKGYIDVHSHVGKGTAFTLYFPVTHRSLEVREETSAISTLKGAGETILVVDDMKDQREISQEMLECLGYRVESAGSGEEAVEYLSHNRVDLLILDMIMDPGIDGLETYRRVLKIRPGQKAIITSGFSETNRVRAAQKLGAGIYIKKPYGMETIGAAIREALAGNHEASNTL